jgi:multicomponent Na+:H+ antiporter subunit E
MVGFTWNLALAVIWMLLTGEFSGRAFVMGLAVGYLCLWALRYPLPDFARYTRQLHGITRFVGYIAWTTVTSSLSITRDVITGGRDIEPGVIGVGLELDAPLEVALMANAVSVPPSMLVVDVSDNRETMYVHVVYLHDEEAVQAELQEVEDRILQLVR